MTPAVRTAPWWIHAAAAVVSRLPVGKYHVLNAIGRRLRTPYWMRLPPEAGGYEYSCDFRDGIVREVCFTGRYAPQETALLRSMVAPGMTFADVGANWGYFTLLGAWLVGPRGRVLAVEADPRMARILGANVLRNALSRVEVLHAAVAASEGRATLSGYDEATDKWGLSRIVENAAGEVNTFDVATAALDDILDDRQIDHVDVLKMDIEGAEEYAVLGMAEGLKRHRYRRILFELHPGILADRGRSAWDVLRRFTDAGYRGWWVDYSPQATREASYTRRSDVARYLRPLVIEEAPGAWQGDAWPHVLWLVPGITCPA